MISQFINKNRWIKPMGSLLIGGLLCTTLHFYTGHQSFDPSTSLIESDTTISEDITSTYEQLIDSLAQSELENSTTTVDSTPYYQLSAAGFTYRFESEEEVLTVLDQVLKQTIGDDFTTKASLTDTEDYEVAFVEKPTLASESYDEALSTTGTTPQLVDNQAQPIINYKEEVLSETVAHISFLEDVSIDIKQGDVKNFSTVDSAVAELLKSNITPDTYYIESGDSPYSVALKYDMSLDEIYALNEGLEDRATSIHVGDPIIVEKLIPELSVMLTSHVKSIESIQYETINRNDDTIYEGLEIIGTEGKDGYKLVIDEVQYANDEVIDSIRVSEETLVEPQTELILIGTKPIPETGSVGFIVRPIYYTRITAYFGQTGSYWKDKHTGIDFKASTGTSVRAADGGVVTSAGWNNSYGYYIDIDHGNGVETRYAHNSKLLVSVGDEVGQGQLISKSGSTGNSSGPHLHFELIINGEFVDPLDYFNKPYPVD